MAWGGELWRALSIVLSQSSCRVVQEVFSSCVQRLLGYKSVFRFFGLLIHFPDYSTEYHGSADTSRCTPQWYQNILPPDFSETSQANPIDRILEFVIFVSNVNDTVRRGVLNGGVLVLLLAMIADAIHGTSARPAALHQNTLSVALINVEALELSVRVHTSSFIPLRREWCLWHRAIDVLLRDVHGAPLDPTYANSRILFLQLLHQLQP